MQRFRRISFNYILYEFHAEIKSIRFFGDLFPLNEESNDKHQAFVFHFGVPDNMEQTLDGFVETGYEDSRKV